MGEMVAFIRNCSSHVWYIVGKPLPLGLESLEYLKLKPLAIAARDDVCGTKDFFRSLGHQGCHSYV